MAATSGPAWSRAYYYARIDIRSDGNETIQLQCKPSANWFSDEGDPVDAESQDRSERPSPDAKGADDEEQDVDEHSSLVGVGARNKRRARDDDHAAVGAGISTSERIAAQGTQAIKSRAQNQQNRQHVDTVLPKTPQPEDEDPVPAKFKGKGFWHSYDVEEFSEARAEKEKCRALVDDSNILEGSRTRSRTQPPMIRPGVSRQRNSVPSKKLQSSSRLRTLRLKVGRNDKSKSQSPRALESAHTVPTYLRFGSSRARDLGDEVYEANGCALSDGDVMEEVDDGEDLTDDDDVA